MTSLSISRFPRAPAPDTQLYSDGVRFESRQSAYVPSSADLSQHRYTAHPPDDPEFFLFIGEVVQRHAASKEPDRYRFPLKLDIQSSIQQKYPHAQVLEEGEVGGWKFFLIKNEGRYNVVFQATTKASHRLDNLSYHFTQDLNNPNGEALRRARVVPHGIHPEIGCVIPPCSSNDPNVLHEAMPKRDVTPKPFMHVEEMGAIIRGWENAYRSSVTAIFGYSGSGKFANQVEVSNPKVWRIVLSSDCVYQGPNYIALAKPGDFLTVINRTHQYCIKIPGEEAGFSISAHFIKDSHQVVARMKWTDFGFTSSTPQSSGPLLTRDATVPLPSAQQSEQPKDAQSVPELQPCSINDDLLSHCLLDWKAVPTANQGSVFKTSVEIPPEELDNIESLATQDDGSPPLDACSLFRSDNPSSSTKPSFGDQCEITNVRLGQGPTGGTGLILDLKSGSQVGLTTDGKSIVADVTAPFNKNFVSAMGSGLVYSAPVAAVILTGYLIFQHQKEKKINNDFNKDAKEVKNEVKTANQSHQNLNHLIGLFHRGEIDKQAFLAGLNALSNQLQQAQRHMTKLEHKAAKHEEIPAKAVDFCSGEKARLKQLDQDLHTLASKAVMHEDIKNKPVEELVRDLHALSRKGLLSPMELFQQKTTQEMLLDRFRSSDINLASLNCLEDISNLRDGINLDPQSFSRPKRLTYWYYSSKNTKTSSSTARRRQEKAEQWADNVEYLYNQFKASLNSGNMTDAEANARKLQAELDRAGKHGDVHLRNYTLYDVKGYHSAESYYSKYKYDVQNSLNVHLEVMRTVKNDAGTSDKTFTAQRVQEIKAEAEKKLADQAALKRLVEIQQHLEIVRNAIGKLKDPDLKDEERDAQSENVRTSSARLHELNVKEEEIARFDNPNTAKGILESAKLIHAPVLKRLEEIKKHLDIVKSSTEKLKDPKLKDSEIFSETKKAEESAGKLKDLSLKEEEYAKCGDPKTVQGILATSQTINATAEISKAFMNALRQFQDHQASNEARDEAFSLMFKYAQLLETRQYKGRSEAEAKLIESTLKIGRENPIYSVYQAAVERINEIQKEMQALVGARQKMSSADPKSDEYKKQFEAAHASAKRLKELKASVADLRKIYDPKDVEKLLEGMNEILEKFPLFVTNRAYDYYANTILPLVAMPVARFTQHVLNDFNRFEGYQFQKLCAKVLSTANSLSPGIFAEGITFLYAASKNESVEVMKKLFLRISDSAAKDMAANLTGAFSPAALMGAEHTLTGRAAMLEKTSAGIQVVAGALTFCTSRLGGAENPYVEMLNSSIKWNAEQMKEMSSVISNLHLEQGVVGFGQAGLDLFELMATDASELQPSDHLKSILKSFMPTFHGNLPEWWSYYMGKELAFSAGMAYTAKRPSGVGQAISQGAAWAFNIYSGKYTDDVLTAIMINCRYFLRQPQSPERDRALASSLKNLRYYIKGDVQVKDSDSKVMKSARQFYIQFGE